MKKRVKSNKLNIEFGAIIRQSRIKLALSQEDLADKAGIHRTYISSIELGKVDIGLTVAKKIAEAVNIPLSKIIQTVENSL